MKMGIKAVGLVALVACSLATGAAVAQEGDKGEESGAAAPGASQLYRQMDELKARIALLEDKLQGSLGPEEAKALREEFQSLKAEQQRLSQGLEAVQAALPEDEEYDEEAESDVFHVSMSGFVRAGYVAITNDPEETDFVGLNDGFQLQNARVVFNGDWNEVVQMKVGLEGANGRLQGLNTASGELRTRVRDAWLGYARVPWAQLRVGQFKPFFDAEEKRSSSDLMFASRALEHSGVSGEEGFNERGLALSRDVGVQVLSEPLLVDLDGMSVGGAYMLSVVNGNGDNVLRNDNESVAVVARLEGHLVVEDLVEAQLGVGFFLNERTTGQQPDLFSEDRQGLAVDLDLKVAGAIVQAQFMQRQTSFVDVDVESDRTSTGYHVAVGYELPWGITPAYRYAFLDPTSDFSSLDSSVQALFDIDELTYHTVGLTWRAPSAPFMAQINYTLTVENENRALENDRLELLTQVEF